jgi:hypothetical protein
MCLISYLDYSCSTSIDTLACLREVDVNTLQAANVNICNSVFFGTFAFVPVVDGTLITDRPTQLLKQGKVNGVSCNYTTTEPNNFQRENICRKSYTVSPTPLRVPYSSTKVQPALFRFRNTSPSCSLPLDQRKLRPHKLNMLDWDQTSFKPLLSWVNVSDVTSCVSRNVLVN